jgi:hypothetical protein
MTNADRQRAASIVRYLISRLRYRCGDLSDNALATLLYPDVRANSTRYSRIRKLLQFLEEDDRSQHDHITTGELLDFIQRIQNNAGRSVQLPLLTPEEILFLFQRLIQLTPEERQTVGLETATEAVLLQQALLNMHLYHNQKNYEVLLNLYCTSIQLTATSELVTENTLDEVYRRIPQILQDRLYYLPDEMQQQLIQEVSGTVQREIGKILLKSGVQHDQFWHAHNYTSYIQQYLTAGFVERLTQAVAENKLLLNEFPIYIKTITVEDLGTLPLSVTGKVADRGSTGLLNCYLLELPQPHADQGDLASLAAQSAIRVTIHFSLQDRTAPLDFVLSSSGIGGTLSQMVKVINMALLSDIACLHEETHQNFFPIAHDVMLNQTIIQNNTPSPVWAHSLVNLCQSDLLAEAMTASIQQRKVCFYDHVAFGDSVGRGDYCDFDFLQTVAKAALYARLRAIQRTGIAPDTYLHDLRKRIQRTQLLQEAHSHLTAYPFSSLAQEGLLKQLLFDHWNQEKIPTTASQTVFEAYLLIVETFLQEGMYRRAYGYLRRLKKVLDPLARQSVAWYELFRNREAAPSQPIAFENFSGSLLVRYQLCLATYYYLLDRTSERDAPPPFDTDLADGSEPSTAPLSSSSKYSSSKYFDDLSPEADEQTRIRMAWDAVNKAEKLVAVRLVKYLIINETSQGTFHPHYHLLAQIYFLRARLLLFFPRLVPIDRTRTYLPTDAGVTTDRRDANAIYGGWLYLLEKARLYAACDGNQESYACYTAYQSCIYTMASFLDSSLRLPHQREYSLTPEDCLRWARQLRNHAALSYADTGRHCYYQIKEKSGISKSLNRSYGKYFIEEIPPIREMLNQDDEKPGLHSNGILYIDMELLCVSREACQTEKDGSDPKERIYFFGSNACYILFARGLYHLCSNDLNEFDEPIVCQGQSEDYSAADRQRWANASSISVTTSVTTAEEWDQKLSQAYLLFTYASALAEDGGTLEDGGALLEQAADGDRAVRIGRDFRVTEHRTVGNSEQEQKYGSAQARSVQDLYPHRVTEIVDLAKVFMAMSALLRMYVAVEDAEQLREDLINALTSLHQEPYCRQNHLLSAMLKDQARYNGHLAPFLERCRRILTNESRYARSIASEALSDAIVECRKRILKRIFDGFYQED